MHETLLVIRREFLERVRTKAFIFGTFAFPLFMIAMWVLPAVMGAGRGERTVVVVDEAPAGIGPQVVAALSATGTVPPGAEGGDDDERNTYRVERVARPFAEVRDELTRRVQAKEIDGYLHLPPTLLDSSQVTYRARNIAHFGMLRDFQNATTGAVQAARLQRAGLDAADVAALVRPVEVETARITGEGEQAGSAEGQFLASYIVGILVYMMIILYGANVQRSVLEEKTNRIAEVIVSSMRADRLMLGKVLGVGSVALLQVAIWGVLIGFATSPSGPLAKRLGAEPGMMSMLQFSLPVALTLVAYFILGFLLFASLYAALGAAVNSEQEAQQLQWVVMLPLFIPFIFLLRIVTDPLGPEATALGLIPFTSPMVMPMRVVATEIPMAQILGGLALLAATVLAMTWIAGKIYRVGILSTGKKPTLRELGRWLRAA